MAWSTWRLGLVPGQDGVGLTASFTALPLGLGVRGDLNALLLDLLRGELLLGEPGELLLALGLQHDLGRLGRGHLGPAPGVGLDLGELRVGVGDARLGLVLALHRDGFGVGDLDALLLLGPLAAGDRLRVTLRGRDLEVALGGHLARHRVGFEGGDRHPLPALGLLLALGGGGRLARHVDDLLAVGHGLAGGAVALLLGHVDLGPVDRLRRGSPADRHDVPALVGDVADVDVDQLEADLVDLLADVLVDQGHELLAVLVDLLDRQGGDDQAKLAENDVLGLVADLAIIEGEQTLGRVVHQHGVDGDAHRERRGYVDPDVVHGQRAFEGNVDDERLEAQVLVVLDEGQDEGAAAVEASGRLGAADAPVHHEHPVARAPLVAGRDEGDGEDEQQEDRADRADPDNRFRRQGQGCGHAESPRKNDGLTRESPSVCGPG